MRMARTGRHEAEPMVRLVLNDGRYTGTEERRTFVEALLSDLLADGAIATWPVPRLLRQMRWVQANAEAPFAGRVAQTLLERWRATTDPADMDLLAGAIEGVLPADGRQEERIVFLRERLARAEGEAAARVALQTFDTIVGAPHEDAREADAFSLLPRTFRTEVPEPARRLQGAERVRRLADWVREARRETALGPPEERAKRTRAEARTRAREATTASATAAAARFAEALASPDPLLRPWFEAERVGFAAEARADLARTEGEARELLDAVPAGGPEDADRLLAERAATVLAYAATRRGTPDGLADRVLSLLRARIAAGDTTLDDRYHVFRLLVALDRASDLEKDLVAWASPEDASPAWPLALAYLYAETDRLRDATAALDRAAARADLPSSAWASAARWHLVLRDDTRREAALEHRLREANEWELWNEVNEAAGRIAAGGPDTPAAVGPDTLAALRALLGKTNNPGWHLNAVRTLYRANRDTRVLETLADGVTGRSPEASYEFLAEAAGALEDVHEEATLDGLAQRIVARLATVTGDADRRTLNLLHVAVESRATQVPRPDPRHATRARAALAQAVSGRLAPEEHALLARHLGTLEGAPALEGDVPRLLESLLAATADRPLDRLAVGKVLADVLWRRGKREEATARLETILVDLRTRAGGTLPSAATEAYGALLAWWVEAGRWREAERRLRDDAGQERHSDRLESLRVRLLALHADALERRGSTSLGAGATLFGDAVAATEAYLASAPPRWVEAALGVHARLHAAAGKTGAASDAGARYEAFVRERLGAITERDPVSYPQHHVRAFTALREVAGARAAVVATLAQTDREPTWAPRAGSDVWSQASSSLAEWRREAGSLGDLEPRLLALVVAQLGEDLVSGSGNANPFVHRGWTKTFWSERADDFATVAARVAEEHAGGPATVLRAAMYLRQGLDRRPEAVEALRTALAHGVDATDVRTRLALWLVEDGRFEEAWPLVERLAKEAPDDLSLLTLGSRVLHGLSRDADAVARLDAGAKRWQEAKNWTPDAAGSFGSAALDVGDGGRAAAWTEEALRLHQEQVGRSPGDVRRVYWYRNLARARSLLGETDAAVKAAAAAVVASGPTQEQRKEALQTLRDVLARAGDLDAWVKRYEAEVAANGMDAPVIRKSLGRVHLDAGRADAAAIHLRAARDLDPLDAETHGLLVRALDARGDAAEARLALLASVRMAPKNLDAYPDLARRFEAAGDAAEAERARTTAVEAMPSEPDGWRVLAKLREDAGGWARAVRTWGQVVRLRPKEPDGWLALARAQAKAGDATAARTTLDSIRKTTWEERFGDVGAKADALRKDVP
ncbi:MAG TPA: hypothetical protein VND21_03155 [Planctomycetota bacterium]|nr:hypothetical protein [Planctomycetota bacterium]